MTWRTYAFLFILGLGVALAVAYFQSAPGYMDADYYYAGGLRLAGGHGFSEPFLWNYLDDPSGLPHPSHAYWMPLASILAALGLCLTGGADFFAARWPFFLVAACLPPLTAALSFALTSRRDFAVTAGLLAVFAGYYAPFLPTTDTFGLYMLSGGLFFLVIRDSGVGIRCFFLGILAALMHLARADGILWLLVALIAVLYPPSPIAHRTLLTSSPLMPRSSRITFYVLRFTFCFSGYLLVASPWFVRNFYVFGMPFAPAGLRPLWLTRYDQLFAYPASQLTFASWLQSGWQNILQARLWALGLNLQTAFAVQGGIIFFPLILVGLWQLRADRRIHLALLAWGLTFGVMTVVFPFAGARGGFFHSAAALQPLWWALAPLGLERFVAWGVRRRGWRPHQSQRLFQAGLIGIAALLTAVVVSGRVIGSSFARPSWGDQASRYEEMEGFLDGLPASRDAIVIVANPPGYYVTTGRPAIAIPDGDAQTVLEVAARYGGQYLLLEPTAVPRGLVGLFDAPQGHSGFNYLGMVSDVRLFSLEKP